MRGRTTRRAIVVGLIGGVLFLAASTAQAGWLFVLAAGVLGLVAGSLFMRRSVKKVEIARQVPPRARVGDDVRTGYRVTNPGSRSLPLMRIEDSFEAFGPVAVACERIPPGGEAALELVQRAVRRGVFESGRVVVTSGAPFGLSRSRLKVDCASRVVVVPRWVELRSFPILEPASFPKETLHERARTGAGEQYLGVREYRPGDPRRSVHWRSTARAGRLVVREYEEEATSRVALVLAGTDSGDPPDSAFEHLVAAAASVARYAITTGHPVHLVRAEPDGGIGEAHDPDGGAVLDWYAGAQPVEGDMEALVTAALRSIGRRGTVVVVAPAGPRVVDAVRQVQGAGSRAIVIAADADSWAGPPSGDASLDAIGRMTTLRVLAQGKDLATCLG